MKIHGPMLLAAARLCCAGFVPGLAIAGTASTASAAWSDLWRTPDQQGEALLAAGQPAQAADRFKDPRRRAYADLQAGRYPEAAKLLAPFTDAQSEYNRGNALAKAGQLQAALAAYDAALQQTPGDKDIRHNRDLVERALRQQHQSPQSSSRNGRRGSQGAGSQGSAAGKQNGSGSQQSGSGGQQSAGNRPTATNGSRTGSGQPGNSGAQDSAAGANPQSSGTPQTGSAAGASGSKESAGQAQRDAQLAAALAREQARRGVTGAKGQTQGSRPGTSSAAPQKDGGKAPGADSLVAGGAQTPKQKPESERQLALDQWLRQIPDSPAGLLQRKFLIEHMMKQQDGEDTQESGQ